MASLRISAQDLWVVAQTAWGEARGEGFPGIYAVVWVIRNRQEFHKRWRTKSLMTICRAPMQFSCWNVGDPNLPKLRDVSLDTREFAVCLQAAIGAIGGMVSSSVGRATHYHAESIARPTWAEGQTPVCQVGHHLFYEGIA